MQADESLTVRQTGEPVLKLAVDVHGDRAVRANDLGRVPFSDRFLRRGLEFREYDQRRVGPQLGAFRARGVDQVSGFAVP